MDICKLLLLYSDSQDGQVTKKQSSSEKLRTASKLLGSRMFLDYVVGKTDTQADKTILNRILELSKFSDEDKNHIFALMDAFIAKRKIQSIL